jgi:hypothetical protein
MKLTDPQRTIAKDPRRFRIVAAGRRFGKTFLAIRELAYFARIPNKNIYAIFPTYRQAKTVMWEDLKHRFTELRWVKKINETDLRIDLVNGSRISLRGADNPDSLRGVSLDFVVFDEFADIDPVTWDAVIRPALADKQGHALWISSPKGKNHFYDLYTWAKDQPDWGCYKYTTLDGGNVPPEEVELARQQMDERTFRSEFLADWVDYIGLVYYAFNEDHVKRYTDGSPTELHIGMDFNIDPGSAVVGIMTPQGLHIIDEVELRNSNTFEMADEIRKRYPNCKITVYPDPAGSARKTSSVTTDHKILHNAGFNVLARRSHPPVKDRINSVNSAFSSGKILIDPRCKSLRNCLIKLSYREGTNEQDKNSGLDHMPDALGYMVEYLYPITKIQPPRVEPARWAVNAPPMRRFG